MINYGAAFDVFIDIEPAFGSTQQSQTLSMNGQ
jgi:hypothetical protein